MSTVKETVRKKYAGLAESGTSCCKPSCCGGEAPRTEAGETLVDYGSLKGDVVAGSDLGLGCGTPTAHADLRPGETVLDLGSGAGIDVFLAAKEVGARGRVIGVDMTPEMIARARRNAAESKIENVEFRLGDIEALPLEDGSVDVVLSNCVINLAPDKPQVFREVLRVLRPGGRLVISDMVTYGEVPAAIREDLELWAGCVAGAMDREDYLAVIRKTGFERVLVKAESTYDSPDKARFGLQSVTVEARKPA